MRNEFTALVERDGPWYVAYSPEIPGANGQGETKAAALKSLANAIALILEDRRKDGLRGRTRNGASGEGRRRVKRGDLLRHLRKQWLPSEARRPISLALGQSG
jgi:predicted RNase H-like HicB family nuclease